MESYISFDGYKTFSGKILSFYTLKMEARFSSVTFIYRHQYRININKCEKSVITLVADLFISNLT